MVSTHILDTARGQPAAGVAVQLERLEAGVARPLARAVTDADGRVRELIAGGESLQPGTYRISFEIGPYFAAAGVDAFYPGVVVSFIVREPRQHHHVPLLISPYGYSTYRGS